MSALLQARGLKKSYDDRVLFAGVEFSIGEGERVALLGDNGCGKSTLLSILAGIVEPEEGEVVRRRGLRWAHLAQDPVLPREATLLEAVCQGDEDLALARLQLDELHQRMAVAQQAELESLLKRAAALEERTARRAQVESRAEALLDAFGLEDPSRSCAALSGGERRRVAICRAFAGEPELLLLDEPTNHLDALAVERLEDELLARGTPFVVVTHDRWLLERCVDRILELDMGAVHETRGNYGDWVLERAARLEIEGKHESSRLNLLRRETAWMRRGAPARTTKAKARIGRWKSLVDSAPDDRRAPLDFAFPPGPRLGDRGIDLERVDLARGERAIISGATLSLAKGERLGVLGPSGAGKTTLLDLASGLLEPTRGSVRRGETVRIAVLTQGRRFEDESRSVIEEIAGRSDQVEVGGRAVRAEAYLERFLFQGQKKHAALSTLSGGERARVWLARLCTQDANILVLDEPTNDLDLSTLRALEAALCEHEGAIVVASHDRWFLDRVCTRVVVVEPDGSVRMGVQDPSSEVSRLVAEHEARRAARKAAKSTPARSKEAPEKAAPRKKGLAPWEQREKDELWAKVGELEAEKEVLDAELAAPALWSGPRESAQQRALALQARQKAAADALAKAWARLEELEAKA
jgi:ATP-binding cassette subfamily F protein uup